MTEMPYTEEAIRRLTWQSRRGMLELDVLFVPFMKNCFRQLDKADQDLFVQLLACEDQDLFLWLMQRETPADEGMARAVDLVLNSVRSPQSST